MRWPVIIIGAVLIASVVIFAISSASPEKSVALAPVAISASSSAFFGSTSPEFQKQNSGVQGRVQLSCLTDDTDPACAPQIWTVQAYQGIASVALFKTSLQGEFQVTLPPGQYELRIDAPQTARCVSVGVVVPPNGYISTNLSCEAGTI